MNTKIFYHCLLFIGIVIALTGIPVIAQDKPPSTTETSVSAPSLPNLHQFLLQVSKNIPITHLMLKSILKGCRRADTTSLSGRTHL